MRAAVFILNPSKKEPRVRGSLHNIVDLSALACYDYVCKGCLWQRLVHPIPRWKGVTLMTMFEALTIAIAFSALVIQIIRAKK